MAFIQNNKFREISEQAKGGNEKALKIIQGMRSNYSQEDIDTLVNDYYSINVPNEVKEEIVEEQLSQEMIPEETLVEETLNDSVTNNVMDLSEILDGEMGDLLDENEIEDLTFNKFLENKSKDGVRSRKNSEYFKAYDAEGRQNYMNGKIDSYKKKFNGQLKNIDRHYRDVNSALDKYINTSSMELDDDIELDMNKANDAYRAATSNQDFMNSFGRGWDEDDNQQIQGILKALMQTYGKKNVLAVLNTLRSDNENYKNFRTNQIDSEIGRYSKSIENLLK